MLSRAKAIHRNNSIGSGIIVSTRIDDIFYQVDDAENKKKVEDGVFILEESRRVRENKNEVKDIL